MLYVSICPVAFARLEMTAVLPGFGGAFPRRKRGQRMPGRLVGGEGETGNFKRISGRGQTPD